MASILPDDILNKQLCSLCKKYLSYPPTKIHKNGRTSCGRCDANETTSPNSLYENVAKFSLFPCVNRFEGCNKLLQYKDVPQHEKLCKGNQYSCPLCTSSDQQFSLLGLINHYKHIHKDFVLTEPKFTINTNIMSENVYLYCDNSNNCLFFIEIGCTQDRLFLNACVSRSIKVVQRFRLNNILYDPNADVLCSTLGGTTLQHIEVKISDERNGILACKFLYDIIEKTVPFVALDLNSVEEEQMKEKQTYRKLPKIYLDDKIFPDKQKYKLSACKSKLINEYDSTFKIQLKCDMCTTFFWDVSRWANIKFQNPGFGVRLRDYDIYRHNDSVLDDIICLNCYNYLNKLGRQYFQKSRKETIFTLEFYCRYNCGMICSVCNLLTHETSCEFNLKKDCLPNDVFVQKCFEGNSFDADDRFVIGNIIEPFSFEIAFYSFAIFGPDPKIQNPIDVSSPEKVIYLITNDGLKCKVYYKYENRQLCVRVDHDYDRSKYIVKIFVFTDNIIHRSSDDRDYLKKIMYVETSKYVILDSNIERYNVVTTQRKQDGVSQRVSKTPCFIVNIKKLSPSCNLIL